MNLSETLGEDLNIGEIISSSEWDDRLHNEKEVDGE